MAAKMTKSPRSIALQAMELGNKILEPYSHPFSPRRYTQSQLFSILVLRQFLRTDLRGIIAILKDAAELRSALQLKRLPNYSTLSYAEKRFSKKSFLFPFSRSF